MSTQTESNLSRRERQIMDIVYAQGKCSAKQVLEEMDDPPSYSAVRALIRILVDKGHLEAQRDGIRYVYQPTKSQKSAGASAMKRALNTFFEGDISQAMAALIQASDANLTDEQIAEIQKRIELSQKEGN